MSLRALGNQLEQSPCRVLAGDMRRESERDLGLYTYP